VGRLAEGTEVDGVRAWLSTFARRLEREYRESHEGLGLTAVPLGQSTIPPGRRNRLALTGGLLATVVGLLLLIAGANVANLLLARALARSGEIAVRLSLGAGRGRLVRQLLTESLLLSLAGGALGVLLAWWGVRALAQLDPGTIPRLDGVRIDGAVLAFSLGVSVLTGLVFGFVPALHQSRLDLRAALQSGGRGSTGGRGSRRFRNVLVIAEVAMAFVILIQAGLLVRSFAALLSVDPGFHAGGVIAMELSIPGLKYDTPAKKTAFYRELQSRVAAIPGVRLASAVYPLPMSGDGWSGSFIVEEQPLAPGQPEPHAEYAVVLPGYFRALGIPRLAGRDFTDQDAEGAPEVVIVDELLAKRHWPGQSPIGKRINLIGREEGVWAEVVGVAAHVRNAGPQEEGEPQIYMPYLQRPQGPLYVVVTAAGAAGGGDPAAFAPGLRRTVRSLDPDQPIASLRPMRQIVDGAVARPRFSMLLLALFAAVALVLAAVGLYGVIAGLVSQRVHEIGIRLALGGTPRHALGLILGEGMMIVLAGLLIGLAGAAALSRTVSSLLFSTAATDPLTYGAIAALVTLVALAATWLPARRATRVDPLAALRES
jgi:putative ABC transport system permease protein